MQAVLSLFDQKSSGQSVHSIESTVKRIKKSSLFQMFFFKYCLCLSSIYKIGKFVITPAKEVVFSVQCVGLFVCQQDYRKTTELWLQETWWRKNPFDFGADKNHRADTQIIFHFSSLDSCRLTCPPWLWMGLWSCELVWLKTAGHSKFMYVEPYYEMIPKLLEMYSVI